MSRNTDFQNPGNNQVKPGIGNRLVVVGAVSGMLLGSAAIVGVYFGNNGAVTSGRSLFAQAGAPPGYGGAPPGYGGAPGMSGPGTPRAGASGTGTGTRKSGTSFDGAPEAYQALQGGQPGAGGIGTGGASAIGGTAGGADFSKLAPVKRGAKAPNYRVDPFVSYRIQPYQKPPAYSFIAPLRLADYPAPPKPKANPDPNIEFGPLPYVPRRVSGILYNGAVSAILETGGTSGDTQVVVPGSSVPSGIPNVGNLTVSSITPTQLTLRAPDGRTVSVDLSASPTGTPQVGNAGGFGGAEGGDPRGGFRGGSGGGRGGVSGPSRGTE